MSKRKQDEDPTEEKVKCLFTWFKYKLQFVRFTPEKVINNMASRKVRYAVTNKQDSHLVSEQLKVRKATGS